MERVLAPARVAFAPESGHEQWPVECLLSANSGLMQIRRGLSIHVSNRAP